MTPTVSPGGGGGGNPPAPPPPPKPPPLHTSTSLWDPVGDPGKLRACAQAWRTLGSHLQGVSQSVTSTSSDLSGSWSGDAYDKFTAWVKKYTGVLDGAVNDCSTMAKQLDDTANYLEEKNNEIHHLYEAIAITAAVGIGLSIITFGFSDAAAAGAAAAEAAEAEGVLAAIGSFLSSMATSMASTLASFAGRWAAAFAIQVGVNEGLHVVQGQPLSFNINDLTNSINGATAAAAIPGNAFSGMRFGAGVRAGIAGAGANFLGSAENGDPFSIHSLERDGLGGLLSAGVGQGLDYAFAEPPEATSPSGLIDPSTGRPFGAPPEPQSLVGPDGQPLDGPPTPGGPLIDPSTGLPYGQAPTPQQLVVPGAPPANPPALLDPGTGLPYGTPPPRVPLLGANGQPVGSVPAPQTLVGPDGQPLPSSSGPGPVPISLPSPREAAHTVAEAIGDKGVDTVVEYLIPTGDGHYQVETLTVPTSQLSSLGPAPGAP